MVTEIFGHVWNELFLTLNQSDEAQPFDSSEKIECRQRPSLWRSLHLCQRAQKSHCFYCTLAPFSHPLLFFILFAPCLLWSCVKTINPHHNASFPRRNESWSHAYYCVITPNMSPHLMVRGKQMLLPRQERRSVKNKVALSSGLKESIAQSAWRCLFFLGRK